MSLRMWRRSRDSLGVGKDSRCSGALAADRTHWRAPPCFPAGDQCRGWSVSPLGKLRASTGSAGWPIQTGRVHHRGVGSRSARHATHGGSRNDQGRSGQPVRGNDAGDARGGPPDRCRQERPLLARAELLKGVRHSAEGWIDDVLAFCSPWGFDVADISVPVYLWHGGRESSHR